MPRDAHPAYEPREYWTSQHQSGTLKSVGQSGETPEFNEWLYRIGRRNVVQFLHRNGLVPLHGPAYDVGSGTGYWVDLWQTLGASPVDGCDLVPVAVERLQARFLNGRFVVGDIADVGIPGGAQYGFVAVMNVLLHIIDEDRFVLAAQNVARAVAPGGHLLMAEPAVVHPRRAPYRAGASSRTRTVDAYVEAMARGGLGLVDLGASTVVGANPIDAANGLSYTAWRIPWQIARMVSRLGAHGGNVAGRSLASIDRVLMRTGAAPSGKLLLFRRTLEHPE